MLTPRFRTEVSKRLGSRSLFWPVTVPPAVVPAAEGPTENELSLLFGVIGELYVAGAGLSAALPGVCAAHTDLPVIGVPLTTNSSAAGGLDALLAIAQMPPGVPVACVGLNAARNAAVLAARILGT